jgi:hypothetical protein
LPSWWEDGFLIEESRPGIAPAVERSIEPLQGGVEFAASHRLDGVLMMTGGPVTPGAFVPGARIIDVAPTVLYLLGEEIPDDMDGHVLVEALDPDFVADHPIEFDFVESRGVGIEAGSEAAQAEFTDDESEMISRRLQALGYIK